MIGLTAITTVAEEDNQAEVGRQLISPWWVNLLKQTAIQEKAGT